MTKQVSEFHTPARTHDQRMSALQIANDIRVKRAQLKRDLHSRVVRPVTILENPPPYITYMKVYAFLMAIPELGDTKVTKLLKHVGCSTTKTISGLSERQFREIIEYLKVRDRG